MTASTATAPRSSLFFTRKPLMPIEGLTRTSFAQGHALDGTEQRVLRVEGMPVFRSGTFRDSTGWQSTWEALHIQEMVRHFDYLLERGIFADVPVRAGHPAFFGSNPIHEVIGYHTALRSEKRVSPVDGQEYEYLLADYDIFDEEAQKKINSTLWRNRSAEVGTYVDNAEAEYAPTYMGVAYVDIPAVESLNHSKHNSNFGLMMEDDTMSGSTLPTPQPPAGTAPAAPATPAAPAPSDSPFAFSIGGRASTNPVEVQTYVTSLENEVTGLRTRNTELESFRTSATENMRADFVNGLAAENKIGADQIDGLVAFAKGLSDEHFDAWKGTYSGVQPSSLFGNHGSQAPAGTTQDSQSGHAAEPDAGAVPKGILGKMFRAGVSKEKLKNSPHFHAATAADPKFNLDAFLAGK